MTATMTAEQTPPATLSNRLYDLAGGVCHWDGEHVSDTYAIWRPAVSRTVRSPFHNLDPGVYEVRAKDVRPDALGRDVGNLRQLWDQHAASGTIPVRWSGVAHLADGGRRTMLDDPEKSTVCDVFVRTDGVVGPGDRDDPLYIAVRYRPLYMGDGKYSGRTAWMSPEGVGNPLVVKAHRDEVTAVVMPVKCWASATAHIRWAD